MGYIETSKVDESDRDDASGLRQPIVNMKNIRLPQPKAQVYVCPQPKAQAYDNRYTSQYGQPLTEGQQPVINAMYQVPQRRRIADVSNTAAPEGISSCAVLLLIVGLLFLLYTFFVRLPKGFHSRTQNQKSSVVSKKTPVFLKTKPSP